MGQTCGSLKHIKRRSKIALYFVEAVTKKIGSEFHSPELLVAKVICV
jgi:hypothetical protein